MNRFSRIRHHVSVEDVKKKRLESIAVENFIKTEEEITKTISEKFKHNWRKELEEGMTTSNALSTVLPAEGDTAIDQVSPTDATSFADVNNMFGAGTNNPALDGATIRANGSGSGNGGGFNVGGNYLAFQGDGSGASRMALLKPIDATKVDTLTITAIRGNDSNGGEDPDVVGQEELFVIYKTPEMSRSSYISQDRNQNNIGSFPADAAIIAIGQGDGTLQDYTITIPEYARQKDTVFGLFQLSHSGSGFDHYGVTDIKFQRKTPINVVVPLDSPEAISFVRVGTNEGDPKKRKKKVNDQLAASDEYTTKQLGDQFPGQGARLGDDTGAPDPFSSASIQEPEASPIGKGEVKKSFANFSATAAATEPEAEPTAPSAQTTMTPTNDDGDPIPVKPVGAKNSGVVQGADAANVDAQNAQEPETTEPETTEPETDPEEIKASEEEKQGKTEEEIEEIENEKFNAKADESANAIEKLINFRLDQGLASFNAIAQVTGVAVNAGINIASLALNVLGMKEANGLISMLGKVQNSIDIARSVLSGKVTNANVLPQEITSFTNSMKPDEFQAKKIFISDVRHEYADDNIYVKNGEIYSNRDGDRQGVYASPLANQGFEALGIHGNGYAQMIIPKDGSDPYLHYYDHNYENLNNIADVSATGGIISTITGGQEYYDGAGALFKSISNIIHQLKTDNTKFIPQKLRGTLLQYFMSFDQVLDGLKSTSSLEGFPPGIHGSALTDFKVPLSKLPQETQDMIAKHPLSWTPERVANMTEDQIYDQLFPLLETDEQFDNYLEFTADISKMSVEPVNTVPYAVAMQEINELGEEYQDVLLQKYGEDGWEEFTNSDEFFAAERAAVKDLETLEAEEQKELDEIEKTIGLEAQMALYDKLVKPLYDSVSKTIASGGTVPKSTMDRLGKQHAKWKKQADSMKDDFYRKQSEIMDKYRDQREPIENIAYAQLTTLREPVDDSPFGTARYKIVNYDGDVSSGGDYTALDGTVYKGKNTYYDEYYNEQEQFYGQMEALYNPVQKLKKYVDGAFVRENIASEFENDFGFSSDNWSPAKSGDGVRRGDDSFIDPFKNEIKPGLGGEDGDLVASAEKGNYDLYNWMLKTYPKTPEAAEWYLKTGKTKNNPFLPQGAYVPLASTLRNLGSVAAVGGVDATAAATAAAATGEKKKKKKKRGTTSMVAHYQPIGSDLLEKYARPQPKKQLERLKSKGFFNPKDIKPTFPPNDPPELDPKTKMHPNYGKQAGRYKRLDPISANAMPPTGDPEIDAMVDKQRTKPKTKKQKYLAKVAESKKYTWREDFTNITTGMKVGQTFRHNPSGQTVTTGGALGGIETVPSTVSIFGDNIPGPNSTQYGLQGFAKPILMKRRKAEDTNKKLDASQEFAQKVGADVMMNARVEDSVDSALLSDLGYKSTEDILAEVGDVWTYEEYMAMMNAIGDKAAAKSLPITKKILEYSPTGKHPGDVPISLIDAQEAITIARQKAEDALARAWERYNKIPEPQDGFGGGQGNPTNRRGSGFDTEGELDDSGYGMDPDRDTETEARPEKKDFTGSVDDVSRSLSDKIKNLLKDKGDVLFNTIFQKVFPFATDRFASEVRTFLGYLTGINKRPITNKSISKSHLRSLFKNATTTGDGRVNMKDFIVGTGQRLQLDPNTNKFYFTFTYDFNNNATELLKRDVDGWTRFTSDLIGSKHGYDSNALYGKMIDIAKSTGRGQAIKGRFDISASELMNMNKEFVRDSIKASSGYDIAEGGYQLWSPDFMMNLFAKGGDVTSPESISAVHAYYAATGKLPEGAKPKGTVPMNQYDHPEYDPAVIKRIKAYRNTKNTDIEQSRDGDIKKAPSKAVNRIKSMTKTRNQSLSLDEPIVKRKKKKS